MLGAITMGAFWQQLAFVGHDVGHSSITHDFKFDSFYGTLFGNTIMGISLSWWKRNHNTHHVICNSVEHDPDIQHMPMLCVSDKLFGQYWSTYYEKFFTLDLPARLLISVQHYMFYPIMALARFNLYAQSYIMLLSGQVSFGLFVVL